MRTLVELTYPLTSSKDFLRHNCSSIVPPRQIGKFSLKSDSKNFFYKISRIFLMEEIQCELSDWGKRCQERGHVGTIEKSSASFQPGDWSVLGMTLVISASVGVYWAWRDRKKTSTEYMTGGGNVGPLPIAMSLATTLFSAVTILGTPVEFYQYGTMFGYFLLTYFICTVLW